MAEIRFRIHYTNVHGENKHLDLSASDKSDTDDIKARMRKAMPGIHIDKVKVLKQQAT